MRSRPRPIAIIGVAGTLFPIAPWGRSSLQSLRHASDLSAASAGLMNLWPDRHSARNRPWKAASKASSVGFPGDHIAFHFSQARPQDRAFRAGFDRDALRMVRGAKTVRRVRSGPRWDLPERKGRADRFRSFRRQRGQGPDNGVVMAALGQTRRERGGAGPPQPLARSGVQRRGFSKRRVRYCGHIPKDQVTGRGQRDRPAPARPCPAPHGLQGGKRARSWREVTSRRAGRTGGPR